MRQKHKKNAEKDYLKIPNGHKETQDNNRDTNKRRKITVAKKNLIKRHIKPCTYLQAVWR